MPGRQAEGCPGRADLRIMPGRREHDAKSGKVECGRDAGKPRAVGVEVPEPAREAHDGAAGGLDSGLPAQ